LPFVAAPANVAPGAIADREHEADMHYGLRPSAAPAARRRAPRALLGLLLALTLSACGQWSWNPATWFNKKPEAPPPVVEVLGIESRSANPAGDRFTQSWEGARLVVDIYSDTGIGRAVVKPRDQGWPLRLAFRLHLSAVEGFEVRGAQNLRWSLGHDPLTEPAMIDLPAGAYTKESPEIEIQWVDHYR
jgi:hypothetical protein